MTTEEQDSTPQAQAAGIGPGALLQAAREARGLSQQAVAERLNLRLTLVKDFEQDRFDPRTASTFTRGYLRTFAKLVGADEAAVLAAYDGLGLGAAKQTEMQSFSGRTRREANENRLRLVSWLLFVGLGVLLFVWWWQQPAEAPEVLSVDDSSLEEHLVPMPDEDLSPEPAPPELGDSELSPLLPEADAAAGEAPAVTVPLAPGNQAPAQETEPAAAVSPQSTPAVTGTAVSPQSPAAAAGEGLLTLRFSGDCWLKITDADGKVVLEGTKRAGTVQSVSGKAPFKLVLGAPHAVSIEFQEQPIDMTRFKRGQIARFVLPLQS